MYEEIINANGKYQAKLQDHQNYIVISLLDSSKEKSTSKTFLICFQLYNKVFLKLYPSVFLYSLFCSHSPHNLHIFLIPNNSSYIPNNIHLILSHGIKKSHGFFKSQMFSIDFQRKQYS